jgi:hypothetical protein
VAKSPQSTKKPAARRPSKMAGPAKSKAPARKAPTGKPNRTSSRISKRMTQRPKSGGWSWGKISNERKIDVLGVVMALLGLLTLLSLISSVQGEAMGMWIGWLGQLAGKGAFVLPITLILVGLWLIFRNLEHLPLLSLERMIGIVLLYFNILTFLHLVTRGSFVTAGDGQGGGLIGAAFAWLLERGFGLAGAYVAVVAWFLIALAFTFDVSISELFRQQHSAGYRAVDAAAGARDPRPAHRACRAGQYRQGPRRLIEDTLASFGAPAHVVDISRGPTVTQFGVEPDFIENRSGRMRVRVSKIANLADDLALALAAPRIRIQAPVPGRSYVGIEVPNTESSPVSLREIMEADSFKRMRAPLRFASAKDVAGKPGGLRPGRHAAPADRRYDRLG